MIRHPSSLDMRTAIALDQAAERAGLVAVTDKVGKKWNVGLAHPYIMPPRMRRLDGLTRTSVVAVIAALNAVGDLKESLGVADQVRPRPAPPESHASDPVPPTPLHGQARGTGS